MHRYSSGEFKLLEFLLLWDKMVKYEERRQLR